MNLNNLVLVCVAALLLGLGHSVSAYDAQAANVAKINDADAEALTAVPYGVGLNAPKQL